MLDRIADAVSSAKVSAVLYTRKVRSHTEIPVYCQKVSPFKRGLGEPVKK